MFQPRMTTKQEREGNGEGGNGEGKADSIIEVKAKPPIESGTMFVECGGDRRGAASEAELR